VESNIAVAVAGYDLCPSVKLPEIVNQVKDLVAFLHKKHPNNPLILSGHSAGGHLAAMMQYIDWNSEFGFTKQFIKGLCLISGVFDLTPIRICNAVNTNNCLQIDETDVNQISPWILGNALGKQKVFCPVLFVVGSHDPSEFIRQSEEYCEQQKNKIQNQGGVLKEGDVKMIIVEGKDHFDVVENFSMPDYQPAVLLKEICHRAQ